MFSLPQQSRKVLEVLQENVLLLDWESVFIFSFLFNFANDFYLVYHGNPSK